MIAWKKKRSVLVSFYLLICISCKISYMQWYTQEIIKISCSKFEKRQSTFMILYVSWKGNRHISDAGELVTVLFVCVGHFEAFSLLF